MISVIIPTFKPGDYLVECLASLDNQFLSKTLFEVIVVLNGPKSPFFEQLNKLKESFPLLHLSIFYAPLKGVSNARNFGIIKSSYDNIVFIDDDDLISGEFLVNLYENRQNQSIVVSRFQSFNKNITDAIDDYVGKAYHKCRNKKFNLFTYRGFLSSACGKLIPKSVIKGTFFNTNLSKSEDALFMFKISKNIENIILASEKAVYYRRKNPQSATRKKNGLRFELSNTIRLWFLYSISYIFSPFSYNFLFYISRLMAANKLLINTLIRK